MSSPEYFRKYRADGRVNKLRKRQRDRERHAEVKLALQAIEVLRQLILPKELQK